MGLFDFLKDDVTLNRETGLYVLQGYFDEAIKFSNFPYSSFDQWESYLNSRVPDFVSFIGELVRGNVAATTEGEARDRLIYLANESGGTANESAITQSAGGRGDTINWFQAVPEVAYESGAELVDVASDIGQGVLSTGRMLKYLPWILIIGGGFYIYTLAKGHNKSLGKSLGKLLS